MTLTWKRSEEVTQQTYVSTELYWSLEVIGLKRLVKRALLERTAREWNEN